MSEPIEDLSVSMPAGRERAVDDPKRPGVRLGELRHGQSPIGNRQWNQEEVGLRVFGVAIGVALALLIVVICAMSAGDGEFAMQVLSAAGGLFVLGLLVFIAWQLWRIAKRK
jgi:hypothetical protein